MMFCSKFDRSFKSRCFKSPVGSCRSEFASYTQPQMVPMDPVWPADHGKSLVIRLKFGLADEFSPSSGKSLGMDG